MPVTPSHPISQAMETPYARGYTLPMELVYPSTAGNPVYEGVCRFLAFTKASRCWEPRIRGGIPSTRPPILPVSSSPRVPGYSVDRELQALAGQSSPRVRGVNAKKNNQRVPNGNPQMRGQNVPEHPMRYSSGISRKYGDKRRESQRNSTCLKCPREHGADVPVTRKHITGYTPPKRQDCSRRRKQENHARATDYPLS